MSLYEQFHQQFEFVLATTEADKQSVYRLRYQVYTLEFGHAMPGEPVRQLEYDEFDRSSLHCFIRHRKSQEAVACIRVVYPGRDLGELPIESNSRDEFCHQELTPDVLPRELICEVSRAAILGRYRKRHAGPESEELIYPITDHDYKVSSLLGVSVYLASTVMIALIQRRHALALMEPRLARLLGRFGLTFLRVGNIQQFNGVRAAYYIDQHRAEEALKPELKSFYRDIIRSLSSPFEESVKEAVPPRALATDYADS
ncbi:PEP-CTERM/exosortase system-associated acyltransferase [Salinicola halophyticus]|uniref:PEP-CTERM/exosortase system-associated acyltransferase n=1 Tax=Salinicola halophyticus TaxID=1808881 RepID=UPI003F47809F